MRRHSARDLGNIYLIGFSGSGKTEVGRLLAANLKAAFFDSDQMIEAREGCTIGEIFEVRGEEYFRRVESAMIRELVEKPTGDKVVALGGGAFADEHNRNLLRHDGLVVHLSCSVQKISSRLKGKGDRPLLRVRPIGPETMSQARRRRIKELLSQRSATYAMADMRLSTSQRAPEVVAAELSDRIRRMRAEI